ncbi:hypothetical protein FC770_02255 [Nocardioides jishulii]|uniref:Uncharacterized protein n=1 Tax=Nocardioides jishulii TaxID=2575440 RepID=A0A4U2YV77_9ACTN|nr:hypothetical protein FCL41_00455 [Nocardioides jishulii]TKI64021.1 hypothetical protein FC770_02255 [Nocardioides jishulii]
MALRHLDAGAAETGAVDEGLAVGLRPPPVEREQPERDRVSGPGRLRRGRLLDRRGRLRDRRGLTNGLRGPRAGGRGGGGVLLVPRLHRQRDRDRGDHTQCGEEQEQRALHGGLIPSGARSLRHHVMLRGRTARA